MEKQARVLVADDDRSLRQAVAAILERASYEVICAEDGEAALRLFDDERPDAIILDIMMPRLDGFQVCERIRQRDGATPILVLSAKGDFVDKRLGFSFGVNDYLTKPFSEAELLMRLKNILSAGGAVSRVVSPKPKSVRSLFDGDLQIDLQRCEVKVEGSAVALTIKEYQILTLLSEQPGKVYSRDEISRQVWGPEYDPQTVGVPVHIRHIREKIERDPSNPRFLQTAWRFGYRLGD